MPWPLRASSLYGALTAAPAAVERSSSRWSGGIVAGALSFLAGRGADSSGGGRDRIGRSPDGRHEQQPLRFDWQFSMSSAHGFQCTSVLRQGKALPQPLYACGQCAERGRSLCESCVVRCHAGHDVRAQPTLASMAPSVCSCGLHCPARMPPVGEHAVVLAALCSRRCSGAGPLQQALFHCQSCHPRQADAPLLCAQCARLCHLGHHVVPWGQSAERWCACDDACVARTLDAADPLLRATQLSGAQRRTLALPERRADGKEEKEEKGDVPDGTIDGEADVTGGGHGEQRPRHSPPSDWSSSSLSSSSASSFRSLRTEAQPVVMLSLGVHGDSGEDATQPGERSGEHADSAEGQCDGGEGHTDSADEGPRAEGQSRENAHTAWAVRETGEDGESSESDPRGPVVLLSPTEDDADKAGGLVEKAAALSDSDVDGPVEMERSGEADLAQSDAASPSRQRWDF